MSVVESRYQKTSEGQQIERTQRVYSKLMSVRNRAGLKL
jgi:hypothetical protein